MTLQQLIRVIVIVCVIGFLGLLVDMFFTGRFSLGTLANLASQHHYMVFI